MDEKEAEARPLMGTIFLVYKLFCSISKAGYVEFKLHSLPEAWYFHSTSSFSRVSLACGVQCSITLVSIFISYCLTIKSAPN